MAPLEPKQSEAATSNIASDELLQLLEETRTSNKLGDHRDDWLADIGAVADLNVKTKAIFIYWSYLKWAAQKDIKPIHRKSFFRGFHRLFKHKLKRFNFYFISSPAFILSKEEKKLMLEHQRQETAYYKWQKEKQRKLKERRRKRRLEKTGVKTQV